MADAIQKGRTAKGQRNGQSKLKDDSVREIRIMAKIGQNHTTIAKTFSVDRRTISRVVSGKIWKHVPT